jgi:hypothetical protein
VASVSRVALTEEDPYPTSSQLGFWTASCGADRGE